MRKPIHFSEIEARIKDGSMSNVDVYMQTLLAVFVELQTQKLQFTNEAKAHKTSESDAIAKAYNSVQMLIKTAYERNIELGWHNE